MAGQAWFDWLRRWWRSVEGAAEPTPEAEAVAPSGPVVFTDATASTRFVDATAHVSFTDATARARFVQN